MSFIGRTVPHRFHGELAFLKEENSGES